MIKLEQTAELFLHLKIPLETKAFLQSKAKKENNSMRYVVSKIIEDSFKQQQLKETSPVVVTKLSELITAVNRSTELSLKLIKQIDELNNKFDLLIQLTN